MKIKIIFMMTALMLSYGVSAASDSWDKTRTGYTIYGPGFFNSTPFNDLSVPRNTSSITNVAWEWHTIPNGNTATEVQLCYRLPYATTDKICADISADQTGNTSIFDGEDARGRFWMRFKTFGGTYPVYSTSRTADTLHVDYDY